MKRFLLFTIILILIDQITKKLIPGTKNFGAAFGILQGYNILFIILTIAVLVVLFHYRKEFKNFGYYGALLITSGAIGNLIDRFFLGFVRDFIDFKIWPSFNLADSFNTIGVILLVIFLLKNDHKKSKAKK